MNKPERELIARRQIVPARKLKGRVAGTLMAAGRDFVSSPVDELKLTYAGVEGDFHAGITRASGGREPWYARGTEMRNERQVSVLSVEELSEVAGTMGIAKFEPGWIGANIVLEDIPSMTFLPSRTLLFFEGGVTLRIDGANGPCRIAGGEIARALGASGQDGTVDEKGSDFDWTRTDMALDFVEAARMKRGLVAWVEREGVIRPGEEVTVRIWEQWIY
ncbi:MAG: MOSC domain-containing protein [Salaquimonas sp.]|jgi:hypothetical protein|nr:MOSC domain-containing protein [Salaquimonas sp.]